MTRRKVTDLEEFALADVMRPYWPTLTYCLSVADAEGYGIDCEAYEYRRLVHSLDQVAWLLDVGPLEWRLAVFRRLVLTGVHFPSYVQHRLVSVVAAGMNMADVSA